MTLYPFILIVSIAQCGLAEMCILNHETFVMVFIVNDIARLQQDKNVIRGVIQKYI